MLFVMTVITLDYTYIVYVAVKIKRKVKENVSHNAEMVQKQVSRIMLVQISRKDRVKFQIIFKFR
jgi:hypothetical protein